MTDNTQVALLRRMTRSADKAAVENPLTTSRAVRLALTKAANDTAGLALTVSSVAENALGLDDMLAGLPDGLLLVGLHRGDATMVGLIALDMQLRAAILEMQTMGVLVDQPAQDRAPTRTDKSMCDPLIAAFLAAFPSSVIGTALEGWCDGVTAGDPVESLRKAGLILADCSYRTVQMNVVLGAADRQGQLIIALPMSQAPAAAAPPEPDPLDWGRAFQLRVDQAPAALTAVLRRFPLSIAAAQSLQIGQVLPLQGCTVHSVRLISADGRDVGAAKLGQSGGMRAVRLEAAPVAGLTELTTAKADPAALGALAELASPRGLAPDTVATLDMDTGTPELEDAFDDGGDEGRADVGSALADIP